MEPSNSNDPFPFEFTQALDLHSFKPSEIGMLLNDYFDHAAVRGWTTVRIIHGKGIGNLRRMVEAFLAQRREVENFRLAPSELGGWGATIVYLKQRKGNLEK